MITDLPKYNDNKTQKIKIYLITRNIISLSICI